MSESDKTSKKSRKSSRSVYSVGDKVEIEDACSLPSHCSGRSGDSTNSYDIPLVIGHDCAGNALCPGDIVEVLTGSKNGTPFKRKDKALVHFSPGVHIMLSKVDNNEMIGYRNSKNLRIKQSNH